MVKVEVEICDVCHKVIAVTKCFICGKSLCENCRYGIKCINNFEGSKIEIRIESGEYYSKTPISLCFLCCKKIVDSLTRVKEDKLLEVLFKALIDFLVAKEI